MTASSPPHPCNPLTQPLVAPHAQPTAPAKPVQEVIVKSLPSLLITVIAVGFTVAVPGNFAEAGNAAHGEHAFAKCAVCHAKDKKNGIGPSLFGVVGRHAGSIPGFGYSQAMKNSNIVWDEKSLDAFIMAPQ